jgi:hypothetical protein
MMFRSGSLEVTSEVRSVPLGQKRKKGRPKKIQHCLTKSPPMSALATLESDGEPDPPEEMVEMDVSFEELAEAAVEDVAEEEVVDLGLKTRKRKHQGLGTSKPPKKKPRLPVPILQPSVPTSSRAQPKQLRKRNKLPASTSDTTLAGPSSDPAPPSPSASTGSSAQPPDAPVKPVPRKCKKKLGACNHEIVFGNHYDRKEWNLYAHSVRLAKSTTTIDPDYLT